MQYNFSLNRPKLPRFPSTHASSIRTIILEEWITRGFLFLMFSGCSAINFIATPFNELSQ